MRYEILITENAKRDHNEWLKQHPLKSGPQIRLPFPGDAQSDREFCEISMRRTNKLPLLAGLGIFFQAFAALMLEIGLSRLLAIRIWHHFAFLIISCALLGYAFSGTYLLLFKRPAHPAWSSLFFTVTILPLFVLFQQIPFDPVLLTLDPWQWSHLFALFSCWRFLFSSVD